MLVGVPQVEIVGVVESVGVDQDTHHGQRLRLRLVRAQAVARIDVPEVVVGLQGRVLPLLLRYSTATTRVTRCRISSASPHSV